MYIRLVEFSDVFCRIKTDNHSYVSRYTIVILYESIKQMHRKRKWQVVVIEFAISIEIHQSPEISDESEW